MRIWVCHPNTCTHVRLLGPCFKTGRIVPFRQSPEQRRLLTEKLSNKETPAQTSCPKIISNKIPSIPLLHVVGPSVSPMTTNHQDITSNKYMLDYLLNDHFPRRYKLTMTSHQGTVQQQTTSSTHPAQNKLIPKHINNTIPHWNIPRIKNTGNDPIPFQQFQVLFNSLFKVLFIFPSRYLFAIGLAPIFSFRWNLPPTLSCIPKQLDSKKACRTQTLSRERREYHPLCCPLPRDLTQITMLTTASLDYNSPQLKVMEILSLSFSRFTRRY